MLAANPRRTSASSGSDDAASARHLNTTAVTASKVEQAWPPPVGEALKSSLIRAMDSGETSTTWVTKLNAVNDGGGPRGGASAGRGSRRGPTPGAPTAPGAPAPSRPPP